MAGSTSNTRVSAGAFTVTIAGEPHLADLLRQLTHRAAEADGCTMGDADRLAEAVERIMSACLPASRPQGEQFDLRFDPTPEILQVEIGFPAGFDGSGGVEAALAARGVLAGLRALVPDLQFVRAGSRELCRFRCPRQPRRAPDQ